MLLAAPPSHILVWFWHLSCSHFLQHSTDWIHTTGPPHTTQKTSPSTPSSCIAAFVCTPIKVSHLVPSSTLVATLLSSKQLAKTVLDTSTSTSSKSINPSIQVHTAFFTQASCAWAATLMLNSSIRALGMLHISTFYKFSKLGIYIGLPNSIPKLYHPFWACIISKVTCIPCHPNVFKENLDPGTLFRIYFSFFNKFSCWNFTSSLTIVDTTTSHIFGYPSISKRLTLQFIKTFIKFSRQHL